MKQYRIICDDETQCGEVYDDEGDLYLDARHLTRGHDDDHGHLIQVREVSDWVAYEDVEEPA
jgi:hypothetical protein